MKLWEDKSFAKLSETERLEASSRLMKILLRDMSVNEALSIWQRAIFLSGRSGYFDETSDVLRKA